ncbi:hypothetical protein D9757_006765 [Collybiopsis confluens]|uniref:Uncharacterized protein n=1 Tax=Collybiopsis confluens TaxID=2823264 RepID=A0A8H5HLW7_9AGAR|nr:hypothetical protein D9757_006765 [Collybiopsis confluens]
MRLQTGNPDKYRLRNSTAMALHSPFVENYDNPRIQSTASGQSIVKNAMMTWPFINDGIPILYYGQEQGYRRGLFLPTARRVYYFLPKPIFTPISDEPYPSPLSICPLPVSGYLGMKRKTSRYSRTSNPSTQYAPLLTPTNGGNTSSTQWNVPSSAKLFSATEQLVDVLTCDTITAGADGSLTVTAKNGLPGIDSCEQGRVIAYY